MNKKEHIRYQRTLICIGLLAVAIAFIPFYFYLKVFNSELSTEHAAWGEFGDYIGGLLSSIFAFAALVALLYSVMLQSKELSESTEQLGKSAQAFIDQNNLIQKQNFETTFFHLIGLYNQLIQGLSITLKDNNYQTYVFSHRQCFFEVIPLFNTMRSQAISSGKDDDPKIAYYKFLNKYNQLFGHYLKVVSIILEFIDSSMLLEHEKKFYARILRAQLSLYELVLIYLDSSYGNEIQSSLIQKYEVLPKNSEQFSNALDIRSTKYILI